MADLWYGAASDDTVPAREGAIASPTWTVARTRVLLPARLWPVAVYAGSRLLLVVLVLAVAVVNHRSVAAEVSAFDGQWYLRLAQHGYPHHVLHAQSTLGFFPLYPLAIRLVSRLLGSSLLAGAIALSLTGGLVATMLVQQLATLMWGASVGRRATLMFAFFPGSIVFSMAYSECLTIPLGVGCLLALRSKRWLLAGALAGIATAVEPVALVLALVCVAAAARELRLAGWRGRAALRSLVAPTLSVAGIGAFGAFLWVWTGTPFAAFTAQHYGWYEQSNPLGVLGLPLVRHLIAHPVALVVYLPSWNLWNGILGGILLACSLVALWRFRAELPAGAFAWVIGVTAITLWSVMTPPNARMLLVAVPAVIVWARRVPGRWLPAVFAGEAALFAFMSALTLSGHMLP